MAILNNSNAISSGGYDINNSLRIRKSASAFLNRTPASAGNRKTWTWSGWVKRGTLSDSEQALFHATSGNPTGNLDYGTGIRFVANNTLQLYSFVNSAFDMSISTTQVFRDPSAWYHIVFAVDTTQATSSNRIKLYVNGNQVTALTTATYPALNYDTYVNSTNGHFIGKTVTDSSNIDFYDGYLAEVNFIDGQALTPSSFGSTNATTGVWQPAKYTGTYGTNGFYLKFSDIATTSGSNAGLGKDFSGNSNYWTTNNISVTAGTTYDAMTDSPTNTSATVANYCVMNPIGGNSSMTLLNGNLNTSATAYSLHRYGTIGVSSGKWYWEVSPTAMSGASNGMLVGISNDIQETGATFNGARGYFSNDGKAYTGTSSATYGATWTTNDIIGMALDLNAGTLTFYKNNVSQGTAFTGLTGEWFPLIRTDATVTSFINFGQRPFSYTPPTGFVRLNTFNLPTPTILQGNKYMDATLWTGTGTNLNVVNAGQFKPDLVWIKNRNTTNYNNLFDSVRGVQKALYSNATDAEATETQGLLAFNSNGFNIGTNGGTNGSGNGIVAWQWQAGQGSTSSNTSGSITSTVSVNTTAGFSVVTWANTSTNATIGHGLGVAPKMIIAKNRTGTADSWLVYHSALGATKFLRLESTAAEATNIVVWNNTAPTSTVFSIGTGLVTGNFVAYCWADVSGYSKAFSYTGNGSSDGPMVYLGLKPKFVMLKRTDTTGNWIIYDSSRNTYNVVDLRLIPNTSDAEATVTTLDFLSNGFKLRTSDVDRNANGGTYIGIAFAENPFKNSNAR